MRRNSFISQYWIILAGAGIFVQGQLGQAGVTFSTPSQDTSAAGTPPGITEESSFGTLPQAPNLGPRAHRPSPFPFDEEEMGGDLISGRSPASEGAVETLKPVPEEVKPKTFAGIQEMSMIVGDLGFFPKTLFVAPGIPVHLFVTGASKKPLCVMMDSFKIRRKIESRKVEEIHFTPTVPGQYRFYCPVNGIEGTLLVKDPSVAQMSKSLSKE